MGTTVTDMFPCRNMCAGAAAGAAEQDTPVAAARPGSSSAVLDAARSSREKRRDQDQNPRARRASGGARSSRDQVGDSAGASTQGWVVQLQAYTGYSAAASIQQGVLL